MKRLTDTYRHKGQRKQLVQELRSKGIKDQRVLQAIARLPRHWFIDVGFEDWAYQDRPFSIGCGQTISHPHTVAFQTELLQIKSNDKTLEVGTGSGFQAAILQMVGARVFTIERHKELHAQSRDLLEHLGLQMIRCLHGDGYAGWPTESPFDRILLTCGAKDIPARLVDQLKWGGRMVIPVGDSDRQEMLLLEKSTLGQTKITNYGNFSFVPFLQGTS